MCINLFTSPFFPNLFLYVYLLCCPLLESLPKRKIAWRAEPDFCCWKNNRSWNAKWTATWTGSAKQVWDLTTTTATPSAATTTATSSSSSAAPTVKTRYASTNGDWLYFLISFFPSHSFLLFHLLIGMLFINLFLIKFTSRSSTTLSIAISSKLFFWKSHSK